MSDASDVADSIEGMLLRGWQYKPYFNTNDGVYYWVYSGYSLHKKVIPDYKVDRKTALKAHAYANSRLGKMGGLYEDSVRSYLKAHITEQKGT